MPTVMAAISPVIAPVGGPGARLPGRFSGTVSLTRLLKYKGKSSRMRNGVMAVLGIALVAGSVKLLVSSGTPKLATAAPGDAAPAPAATQPTPRPAAKPKTVLTANAQGSSTKAGGVVTSPLAGNKARASATDAKGKKSAPASTASPQAGGMSVGAKPSNSQSKSPGTASPAPKASPTAAGPLGPDHVDKSAGYSVRFPAGWTRRNLSGRGSWLAEASDGPSSMAIGLAADGGHGVADDQHLEALSKSFKARPDTQVQGAGFGTIAGRKCMWHKLSVPAPGTAAGAARISTVMYFAPLGDGRALKVRVVSRQDTFAEAAPKMKQSMDTLRLLAPDAAAKQVAAVK
jgi:hypothetical protein